jgi:hypothetical protein
VSVRDDIRIALDVPDFLEVQSKALGNQLLKDRLVTLAVGVRAHKHGRVAIALEADLATLARSATSLRDARRSAPRLPGPCW